MFYSIVWAYRIIAFDDINEMISVYEFYVFDLDSSETLVKYF